MTITAKQMTEKEWKSRPLDSIYPFVFIDSFSGQVREDNKIVRCEAYTLLGITMEGYKENLGIFSGNGEDPQFWHEILVSLKLRGIQDILILCNNDLPGLAAATESVYPETFVCRCLIHLMQDSAKYINCSDKSRFLSDCKNICLASDETQAGQLLTLFREAWEAAYPLAVHKWDGTQKERTIAFHLPEEIRRVMCTASILESLQRQYARVVNSHSIFVNSASIESALYLAYQNTLQRRSQKLRDWNQVLIKLDSLYRDRLIRYL